MTAKRKPARKVAAPRGLVSDLALARFKQRSSRKPGAPANPFAVAQFPKAATPRRSETLAQDSSLNDQAVWAQSALLGALLEGQAFLGYPILAELAQRPEYRRISETIATQMTRRWIKLQTTSDDQAEAKADRIKELEAELKRLKVRELFREVAEQDGFFGRSHIYLDLGNATDRNELLTPVGDGRSDLSKQKVGKGGLKRLKSIEPVWCYPTSYNSTDPLAPDWYKPQHWFVMGKELHASRLLTFVGREVPDLLKPAYAFGGLPLSQMAKPYVDNWLRTRQSVSDLIEAFSVMVLATNLPEQLDAGDSGAKLENRVDLFNAMRNNRGTMVISKEDETLTNVSAPLGSLDTLQAQSQEHIASVAGIPLIFFTGISPAGLNASSEGEIRAFYDKVHADQETLFRPNLHKLLGFIQLSLWGEVDPDITFVFEPLWALDEREQAEVRKLEAETDDILQGMGAIDAEEARRRVADDPNTPYIIDLSKKIEPSLPDPAAALPGAKPGEEPEPGEPSSAKPNGKGGQPVGKVPAPPTPALPRA